MNVVMKAKSIDITVCRITTNSKYNVYYTGCPEVVIHIIYTAVPVYMYTHNYLNNTIDVMNVNNIKSYYHF